MNTQPTIDAAFKKGEGDVFFVKDNQFIALCRHTVDYRAMHNDGYTLLSYDQVIKLANADRTDRRQVKQVTEKPKQKSYRQTGCQQDHYNYYDEFPDAYNQYL